MRRSKSTSSGVSSGVALMLRFLPMRGVVHEILREYASCLSERFGARLRWVRLYGSQARGDAGDESDVDVAAVVDALTWREKNEAIDLSTDVSLAQGVSISAFVVSAADWDHLVAVESSFAQNILREGIAACTSPPS